MQMDNVYKNFLMKSELYFESLNDKDLKFLDTLYHSDIELYDWNGSWKGKQSVLDMNESLFDSGLEFEVLFFNQVGRMTYNHILIHTGEETLKVLDVIYWDDDFKITKIEAYKG
jgi:hypothetical protein